MYEILYTRTDRHLCWLSGEWVCVHISCFLWSGDVRLIYERVGDLHLDMNTGPDKVVRNTDGCLYTWGGDVSRSVVANVLDCEIEVSKYEFSSRYYTHFRTNALGKTMNPLIPSGMGWIIPQQFFYNDGFGIKLLQKVDMLFNKETEPCTQASPFLVTDCKSKCEKNLARVSFKELLEHALVSNSQSIVCEFSLQTITIHEVSRDMRS